ncbi:MAG TPA: PAS domain S-box protein [Chloroflexia bacterium]|nr:PAS domain S-box protein [Chloroflexia bacterium]
MGKLISASNEAERLTALHRYAILDTPPEEEFDRIAVLAARLFKVPIAQINFLDEKRQWSKASYGLARGELPRDSALCNHATLSPSSLVVTNLAEDSQFTSHPMVISEPRIRFYAGAPLITDNGQVLGVICLMDYQPHKFDSDDCRNLEDLAKLVLTQLEQRFLHLQLIRAEKIYRTLVQNFPNGRLILYDHNLCCLVAEGADLPNRKFTKEQLVGKTIWEVLNHEQLKLLEEPCRKALIGKSSTFEVPLNQATRLVHVVPVRDEQGDIFAGMVVTQDITDRVRTEQALRESEEWLYRILELNVDGLVTVDHTGRVTFANQAAAQILGLSRHKLARLDNHETFCKITTLDGAPFPDEELPFNKIMSTGNPVHDLVQAFESPEGKRTIVSVNAAPFRDNEGKLAGMIAALRDVTSENHIAESLLEMQELFSSAFNNSAIGMALVSLEGSYLQVNRAMCQIFGYEEPEFLQTTFQALTYRDDLHRDIEKINQLLAGRLESYEIEKRYIHKKGTLIWALVTRTLVRDKMDRPLYYIIQIQDITQRHRAEQALQESEERYRSLARNFPNGAIILFDRDLRFLLVEGSGLEAVGLKNEDYVGKLLWEVFPADRAANLASHYRTVLEGQEHYFEVSYKENFYSVHALPIRSPQGEILAGMLMSQNITERKLAEQALRAEQARSELERRRLGAILQILPIAVVITDGQGAFIEANRAFETFMGGRWPVSSLADYDVFKGWWASNGKPIERTEWPILRALLAGETSLNEEIYIEAFDGTRKALLASALPVKNEAGEIVNCMVVGVDITEQKKVQDELKKQTEILQRIFDHIPVMLNLLDKDGRIKFVNREWERIQGWSMSEVENQALNGFALRYPSAEDYQRVIKFVNNPSGEWCDFKTRVRDGRLVDTSWAVVRLSDGTSIGIGLDISERKQAEEAQRQSQELIRLLLDSTAEGIYGIDTAGNCTFCNKACAHYLGYTDPAELLGKNMHELIHCYRSDGSLLSLENCHIYEVIRNGKGIHDDNEVMWRSDGTCFPAEYWSYPIQMNDQTVGAVVTFVDITERKQAEMKLRRMEQRFALAFNASPAATFLSHQDSRIVDVNIAALKMFGYSREEVLGRTSLELGMWGCLEEYNSFVQSLKEEGKLANFEVQFRTSSGFKGYAILSAEIIELDNTTHVLISLQDITERKAAEFALRESEKRFRRIVETSLEGIWIIDTASKTSFVNHQMAKMLGYTEEEMLGRPVHDFLKTEKQLILTTRLERRRQGVREQYDLQLQHKEGGTLWVLVSAAPITNENGDYLGAMGMLTDITARKIAEAEIQELNATLEKRVALRTTELEAANRELAAEIKERTRLEEELRIALQKEKELNELRSRFVSMTSHEFRTPLSTIRANAELLKLYHDRWSVEKRLQLFQRIEDSTGYMTRMLEDILLVGKAESGKLELNRKPLNPVEFCQTLLDEFMYSTDFKHEFSFVHQEAKVTALLDEKLLRQIVENLLSNAVKYSPAGKKIQVRLNCREQELVLEVQDEGIGIPSEDISSLFEVFHRAKNVGTTPGTGLGLTIVKRSVELHGGTITVESQVGVGSCFTVRIPLENWCELKHENNTRN